MKAIRLRTEGRELLELWKLDVELEVKLKCDYFVAAGMCRWGFLLDALHFNFF